MSEKEYAQRYYQEHKEEQKAYREAHKEERSIYMKGWYSKNKIEQQNRARLYREKLRIEIIQHYGGKCICCGEIEITFLTIDHINGSGRQHRKSLGGANRFYLWLKRNNFPEGFQVLCMNCNWSKRMNKGICAHEQK